MTKLLQKKILNNAKSSQKSTMIHPSQQTTNESTKMQNVQILLSDARGQYIPRDFVQSFAIAGVDGVEAGANVWQGINPNYVTTCNYPDHEWYWDAWQDICDNAYLIDTNGKKWTLYQNGDLFAVAYDSMTDEEKEEFFGNW